MLTAAEHFAWAKGRALEYATAGNAGDAVASLTSDLNKHPGTSGILHPALLVLFTGEVLLDGSAGARRFIEGLAGPADDPGQPDVGEPAVEEVPC